MAPQTRSIFGETGETSALSESCARGVATQRAIFSVGLFRMITKLSDREMEVVRACGWSVTVSDVMQECVGAFAFRDPQATLEHAQRVVTAMGDCDPGGNTHVRLLLDVAVVVDTAPTPLDALDEILRAPTPAAFSPLLACLTSQDYKDRFLPCPAPS